MGKECIGICGRYETTGWRGYTRGFKWCSRCYLFIKISTIMCPCCGKFLRISPHTKKSENKILLVPRKGEKN